LQEMMNPQNILPMAMVISSKMMMRRFVRATGTACQA
jgi:hypothetical protein